MKEKIIELKNVNKNYGKTEALIDANLTLFCGDVNGLVGPNGAGKTTMIRLICTLLSPTSGEIYLADKEYSTCKNEVKRKLGYLKEVTNLYNKLSVIDNVKIFAKGRGISLLKEELLNIFDQWNLKHLYERKIKALSNGQRKIVAFLCSIIHNPDIIILDEPFSGLDIEVKEQVRTRIKYLKENNKTILISSHEIDEIEKVATKISLINKGRLLLTGTTEEIKKSILGSVYKIKVSNIPEEIGLLYDMFEHIKINKDDKTIIIRVNNDILINDLLQFLINKSAVIESTGKLNLEEHLIEYFSLKHEKYSFHNSERIAGT